MPWSFHWLPARKHRAPIEIGQRVAEKYRIEGFIAEGGMSLVYAAVHVTLGQRVAIKFLKDELAARPDLVERFVNEARAFGRLSGDHVARVLDVGMREGLPFMVLERLRGRDLHAVIAKSGAQAIQVSVDWALQVCEALAEAHCAGIIHRDIKLENLFLAERPDGSSVIKLLDFGISKQTGLRVRHLTDPNVPMGSPYSMSPEQIRAPTTADARTDIWGLGVVLYELLSGTNPFEADQNRDIYVNVLRQNPRPVRRLRPEVPPGLEAVVMKCLHKQPDQRFRDVLDLAAALVPFGPPHAWGSLSRVHRIFDMQAAAEPPSDAMTAFDGLVLSAPPPSEPGVTTRRPSWPRRVLVGGLSLAFCGAAITLCVPQGRALADSGSRAVQGWIAAEPLTPGSVLEPDIAVGAERVTNQGPLLKLASGQSEREIEVISLTTPAPRAAKPSPKPSSARPSDPPLAALAAPTAAEPIEEAIAVVDEGASPEPAATVTDDSQGQPASE